MRTSPSLRAKRSSHTIETMDLRDISTLIFSRPYNIFYPRATRSPSSNHMFNQLDIFCSAIHSHQLLKFSYIKANIELGEYDCPTNQDRILEAFRLCLETDGEISISWKRPSTVEEWASDSMLLSDKLGSNVPCIYHYNHDHFLVTSEAILKAEIKRVFFLPAEIDTHDISNRIIESSHYSEKYFQYKSLLSKVETGEPCAPTCQVGQHITSEDPEYMPTMMHVNTPETRLSLQGEFIATSSFASRFWNHILLKNREFPTYVARPDWPGLAHPDMNLEFFLPNTELFAHFDGIGDESILFDVIQPLELNCPYLSSAQVFYQENTAAQLTDACIDDFIRTRSYYFLKILEELFDHNKKNDNIYSSPASFFRHAILPHEALYYMRTSLYVNTLISPQMINENPDIISIISIRLVECSLLLLPSLLSRAFLNMPI